MSAVALPRLASFAALVVWNPAPSHAYRLAGLQQDEVVGGESASLHGAVCPDGYVCEPAPCAVEDSNKEPGRECRCRDGFAGTIAWSGSQASGDCTPSPCDVEGSNKEPGLDCRCRDGFLGSITWAGPDASGDCRPSPCGVKNSNQQPGLDCRCLDGFEGEIVWEGEVATGQCGPAPCNVLLSNRKLGLECSCLDHAKGSISWVGDQANGRCDPAPCDLENSNGLAGGACACDDFSAGRPIVWKAGVASGKCLEVPVEVLFLLNEESEVHFGGKDYKCCVSPPDTDTSRIVDLSDKDFKKARNYGRSKGCGRLLGSTWHAAQRSKTCKVKLGELAEVTGVPRTSIIKWVRREAEP